MLIGDTSNNLSQGRYNLPPVHFAIADILQSYTHLSKYKKKQKNISLKNENKKNKKKNIVTQINKNF